MIYFSDWGEPRLHLSIVLWSKPSIIFWEEQLKLRLDISLSANALGKAKW
jgi:hypothetical protein